MYNNSRLVYNIHIPRVVSVLGPICLLGDEVLDIVLPTQ
jgi:hypothetical protein